MLQEDPEHFGETCGKERRSISISRGADLLVGLAHFPLLLPEQVPVLLQRLLLLHHHHPDDATSLLHTKLLKPNPWILPPT